MIITNNTSVLNAVLPKQEGRYSLVSESKSDRFNLFSVQIRNCKMQQAVTSIIKLAQQHKRANFAFVNADCLNKVWSQDWYRMVLARMQEVYADGIGVKLAAKMDGVEISDNVNGTDMFPLLCQQSAEKGLKVFLLGSRPGVVDECARNMQGKYPELQICGTQHGYFKQENVEQLISKINQSDADILVLAFGAPLQEFWMDFYKNELKVPVCIGVGGCFDYYSGRIARAPKWVRQLSMEWCWRLMKEPQRMWKRYIIGNPLFLYRAWKLSHAWGGRHA